MPIDYSRIWPFAIAVLAVLLVYRRLRRSFGRQPLRPVRMRIRIGILLVLGCSLLPAALRDWQLLMGNLAGLSAGVALGVWGARRTRFQEYGGIRHYVPHTVTGIAVSLLLVGRLVYRMIVLYSMNRAEGADADPMQEFGSPAMFQSPFTLALLYVVIGYYVCYYGMVLWRSNRIGPEDLEVAVTPIAVSPNE
jgi:hypothetical protein